jgi:hypothetical protein
MSVIGRAESIVLLVDGCESRTVEQEFTRAGGHKIKCMSGPGQVLIERYQRIGRETVKGILGVGHILD